MARPNRQSVLRWAGWLFVLALVTAAMLPFRARAEKTHVVLAYLLLVLGGSSAGGRWLGGVLAGLGFLCVNYFFIPPYHTFTVADPLDWFVLAAFLVTGIVAAQLLSRAQDRAEVARLRAVEVQRLASLGAETLNAGRAEEALTAVAEVIRSALGATWCEVLVPAGPAHSRDGQGSIALEVFARTGAPMDALPAPGTYATWPASTDVRALELPLVVRERTVGVLRLASAKPLRLDPAARQFLDALSYYAALGVERVRLTAAAERAEAFRQADELKTALIATVSHDLRTPLTTIKALAHDLAVHGDEDALSIEEEADRLNRFVVDLLDLSRLSVGSMRLAVELNVVDDLVGAALDRVRGSMRDRAVVVRRTDDGANAEPLLVGRFDFVQTLRVIVNLVENAIKYAPPGEPIEIELAHVGAMIAITVADRGPGVSPGEASLIFEPFYRPPGAVADTGSAGLGLAIARGIAVAQGGSLDYAPRPGGGAAFTLRIPAASVSDLAGLHNLFMPGEG